MAFFDKLSGSAMFDGFAAGAGKLGSQRHMVAIRDSFATLVPALLAGSVAVVINSFPIGANQGLRDILPTWVVNMNGAVWTGTFGLITVFMALLLGYNLAKSYDSNVPGAMVIALGSYYAISYQDPRTGTTGLMVGIAVAIAATELFIRLYNVKALLIKMPEQVPPAVSRAFASMLPGIITLFVFAMLGSLIEKASGGSNIHAIIDKSIAEPMAHLTNTLPSAILVVLVTHILWVVGIHGANIMDAPVQTIFTNNIMSNIDQFAQGVPATQVQYIVTKPFLDTFVYLGGSGTTLGLLIAIFLVSRAKVLRTGANVSIGLGIFNINAPVMFGLPIVIWKLVKTEWSEALPLWQICRSWPMPFHCSGSIRNWARGFI